jgi:superfamily I DNA and/or RNA helicase
VQFELCIIDESSKATAMECCVPMARAKRWVLVGDSKQLPPFQEEVLAKPQLRKDYDLESAEASESLFERLRRLLPESNKVMLRTQYRMVEPIGRLISDCFYPETPLESHRKEIDRELCGLTGKAVNWMSTRKRLHRTEQETPGKSFVNPSEASHVCELLLDIDDLLCRNPAPKSYSVLVLSGYDAQVRHIERKIAQIRLQFKRLHIECCTIDRVQGRQANVVLFSVTRSNAERKPGFLRALERINVALSRAKDLLVIVGDDDFVERARNADPLQRVLAHIRRWQTECFMGVFEPIDESVGGGPDAD